MSCQKKLYSQIKKQLCWNTTYRNKRSKGCHGVWFCWGITHIQSSASKFFFGLIGYFIGQLVIQTNVSKSLSIFKLGRCNAGDGPASLYCNALFCGGLRPLHCCVAPKKVFHFSSLSHSHTLSGNTMGKPGKRGGSRSKLELKNSVFYTDFFLMRTKYSVTCMITQYSKLWLSTDKQECMWLTSVKISKCKNTYK